MFRRESRRRSHGLCGIVWLLATAIVLLLVLPSSQAAAETGSDLGSRVVISQVAFVSAYGAGLRILILFVALLLFPLKNALATVYYVRKSGNDSNAGTSTGAAWATFTKATSSTSAGDVVYFGSGTYTEEVQPSVSGASGNPIRFIADKDGAKTGDAGSVTLAAPNDKRILNLDSDNYLQFEGFKMSGSSKEGIKTKDSAGTVIANCEVYGANQGIKIDNNCSPFKIVNCLIRDNSKAGIECKGSTGTVWNCTINGNSEEGVLANDGSCALTLTNSIVTNNGKEGLKRANGTLTHTYNLIYGNSSGDFSGTSAGTGELFTNPVFVGGGDYSLQKTSPAIDAGTGASGTVDDDLDGRLRPISSVWDMGCYEFAPNGNLLYVVTSTTSPASRETTRRALIQSFGYSANLIDDDDSQATYNTRLAANNVAYVGVEAVSGSLGSKLAGAAIGVVNEHSSLANVFGFATGTATSSGTSIDITNNTHYITSPFSTGSRTILNSSQTIANLSGAESYDRQILAKWGTATGLAVLEAGSRRYDSGNVLGRRVQLPWGGSTFDINALNADGQTVMKRAIFWAQGLVAWWKLDESSGTAAADSGPNGYNGTVTGTATWQPSGGKLAGDLSLDGATYVQAAGLMGSPVNITVAGWANCTAAGTAGAELISLGDCFAIRLRATDTQVFFYNGSIWVNATVNTSYIGAGWRHFAATFDDSADTLTLYVDGVSAATLSTTSSISYSGQGSNTRIGKHGNTYSLVNFTGQVDDIRVFNYALGASEVKNLKGVGQPKGVRLIKWVEIQ